MEIIDFSFFLLIFSFCARCAIFFLALRGREGERWLERYQKKAREMIFTGTPTVWIIYFNDTVLMSFARGGEWELRDGDEISFIWFNFRGNLFFASRISFLAFPKKENNVKIFGNGERAHRTH